MKKVLSLCLKYLSLFTVMGSIYYLIEIIWRGYSHVSMFILAGVCGICIGLINEILSMDTDRALLLQANLYLDVS